MSWLLSPVERISEPILALRVRVRELTLSPSTMLPLNELVVVPPVPKLRLVVPAAKLRVLIVLVSKENVDVVAVERVLPLTARVPAIVTLPILVIFNTEVRPSFP